MFVFVIIYLCMTAEFHQCSNILVVGALLFMHLLIFDITVIGINRS